MDIQARIESNISAGIILDEPTADGGLPALAAGLLQAQEAEEDLEEDLDDDAESSHVPTTADATTPLGSLVSPPGTPSSSATSGSRLGITPRVFGTATVKRQRVDDLIKTTAQKIDAPDPFLAMYLASQAQQETQRLAENERRDRERREDRAESRAFMLLLAKAMMGKSLADDSPGPKE